jgi:hypothetical protein
MSPPPQCLPAGEHVQRGALPHVGLLRLLLEGGHVAAPAAASGCCGLTAVGREATTQVAHTKGASDLNTLLPAGRAGAAPTQTDVLQAESSSCPWSLQ